MPNLEDVYQKFGEAAEAAQLLETQLGNILLTSEAMQADLLSRPNPSLATEIYRGVNKRTLGQLFKRAAKSNTSLESMEAEFEKVVKERNRLFHAFYREHNFRRNSSDGCQIMLDDLEEIHDTLIDFYKKILLLQGVDLEKLNLPLPTEHANI